jgi:hypothetical protein
MPLLTTLCFFNTLRICAVLRVEINVFSITFFTKTVEKYLLYLDISQFIAKILADLRDNGKSIFH